MVFLELHSCLLSLSIIPLLTPAPSQLLPAWNSLPIGRMAELTFLGTATPFSAFCFPISSYQIPQIEAASPARQIGHSSWRHMALHGRVPASSILSWEHGNTSVSGGFTRHLWQEAVPLFFERFQRWTEHQTPGEEDCLITLRDAWACPGLADAHADVSHRAPAVPQPPLTCMPSSHGVPKSLWHSLGKQDYRHIKNTSQYDVNTKLAIMKRNLI